ncbi:MAG: 50S ribosomal protein L13 [Candidatus Amesbacteria bacterium GW2011_GWA2_47_11b]|uniref:Large ribosomal subunit protein uL13 n=3 Tax=Candidatus Amesiibacteriota TaxID=1752730 RepID=A0A0G1VJ24_9BACT|nr:MAG: 50S ribosomal protein L13 [Microgenomates group bacterium GW2011_GWC1_46_20]KKU57901.1 MAG: 50S ribosomal protein L13 [Candidatus Amesbacteria bacterium GW2011_GWA2_47_11b]KKU70060.1 MAG: 50S ribosomal protein L13 [Candidatus Amesbacteria bacterium GW2011_GWA1_47_20]KKU83928.1 MAG: 50S ribosomal protein L13 [Candidatus Amesbacteria bacterium GW2011_GWC2_47_8]
MKTYTPTVSEIDRKWHLVDASGQALGRLATQIAIWLSGKHKPVFAAHLDMGDNVVVINAAKVVLSGNKAQSKVYYRHSGYPGGLKVTPYSKLGPQEAIRHAVSGMLPKNKLHDPRLLRLHVYSDATHPHGQHFT